MTVVVPNWPAVGGAIASRLAQPGADALPAPPMSGPFNAQALPAPAAGELRQDEVASLLAASRGPARLACVLWLLGLDVQEAEALRCADVDRATSTVRVGGAWPRQVRLPSWALAELPTVDDLDARLLRHPDGESLAAADLQTLVTCAAIDAGLPDAGAITPQRLRYTAMVWLVREGLRFADLPSRVGRLEPQVVTELAAFVGDAPRRSGDEVDALMPALREAPSA
jgi:integrase